MFMLTVEEINESADIYRLTPHKRKKLIDHLALTELRVAALCNSDLYYEYVGLLPGDDYDGCFTLEGQVTIALLRVEIEKRLKGWLND